MMSKVMVLISSRKFFVVSFVTTAEIMMTFVTTPEIMMTFVTTTEIMMFLMFFFVMYDWDVLLMWVRDLFLDMEGCNNLLN